MTGIKHHIDYLSGIIISIFVELYTSYNFSINNIIIELFSGSIIPFVKAMIAAFGGGVGVYLFNKFKDKYLDGKR